VRTRFEGAFEERVIGKHAAFDELEHGIGRAAGNKSGIFLPGLGSGGGINAGAFAASGNSPPGNAKIGPEDVAFRPLFRDIPSVFFIYPSPQENSHQKIPELEMTDKLRVVRVHKDAVLPCKAHATDAGYDISACEAGVIVPKTRELIRTGLKMTVPEGTYGRLAPRSSLSWKLSVDVEAGVIDKGFTNEVKILLSNNGESAFHFKAGDRVAQLILEKIADVVVEEVKSLEDTDRGQGGFGSSGLTALSEPAHPHKRTQPASEESPSTKKSH